MPIAPPILKYLGQIDYVAVWDAMRAFTAARTPETPDEIWFCQHPPVFTLGQAGRRDHLLTDIGIPVVQVDRGGQVTYHGPGQIVVYVLLDLRRRGYGIKDLVRRLEETVIALLASHEVAAERIAGAPGVYVGGAKIAALGLRVRNGCTYHGLSLNVDMDLAPFSAINPCGYAGMRVTSMRELGQCVSLDSTLHALELALPAHLDARHTSQG